jgi:hypothetical protein
LRRLYASPPPVFCDSWQGPFLPIGRKTQLSFEKVHYDKNIWKSSISL